MNIKGLKLSITALLLLSIYSVAEAKRCGHHLLKGYKMTKTRYSDDTDDHNTNRKRRLTTAWQPIRILVDYTKLDSQTDMVTASKRANIKKVVDQTVKMYQTLLYVKRGAGKLIVKENCGEATVSATLKAGVDYDLVLFPYFVKYTAEDSSTEAAATSCSSDETTNRPTTGLVEFNPDNFLDTKTNWLEYYTYLAFHEINHVMVFNSDLFSSYIDSSGKLIDSSKITTKQTINGVERTLLTTPKVVAAAKKHFACPTLIGVELENQGSEGTKGSHWEYRTMATDFMVGESYDDNVFSDMSLAFYEDSGWYKVNYYTGGLFKHGKNAGCDFLFKKCIVNDQVLFPASFCKDDSAPTCSPSRMSRGSCSMSDADASTPAIYKYLSSGKVGGTSLPDFCPINFAADKDGVLFPGNCAYGVSSLDKSFNEVIGDNSSCFYSTIKDPNNSNQSSVPNTYTICYSYTCDVANKNTVVTIGSQIIKCPKSGGPVDVTDGKNVGKLYCPDYNFLCSKSGPCKSMSDCLLKKITELDVSYDYTIGQVTGTSVVTTNAAPQPQTSIPALVSFEGASASPPPTWPAPGVSTGITGSSSGGGASGGMLQTSSNFVVLGVFSIYFTLLLIAH